MGVAVTVRPQQEALTRRDAPARLPVRTLPLDVVVMVRPRLMASTRRAVTSFPSTPRPAPSPNMDVVLMGSLLLKVRSLLSAVRFIEARESTDIVIAW